MTDERIEQGAAPEGAALEDAVEHDIAEVAHDVDELLGRTEAAEAQRDEYLRDLQRLAADFDNFRKRVARDQESMVRRAHERLVRELLPVIDDLGRALDAAESHDEEQVIDGVRLVQSSLQSLLEREGLVEIDATGAFDPHVHEALLTQPTEGAAPGSIVQVVQRGYTLGDVVVRPARVVIAE